MPQPDAHPRQSYIVDRLQQALRVVVQADPERAGALALYPQSFGAVGPVEVQVASRAQLRQVASHRVFDA